MYCSACELEIKGDDKQACPICGAPLSPGADAVASPQDQAAIHDIIDDINSLIEKDDSDAAPGGAAEDVFVLREYEVDSSAEAGDAGMQPPEQQPLFTGDSGAAQEQQPPVAFMEQEDAQACAPSGDEDAGIAEAIGLSVLPESSGESPEDDEPAFLTDFEEDESSSDTPPASGTSRRSGLLLVLLVVLLAAAGFYAYSKLGGNDEATMVRTVTPLSSLPDDIDAPSPEAAQAGDDAAPQIVQPSEQPSAQEKNAPVQMPDEPAVPTGQQAAAAVAEPAQPEQAAAAEPVAAQPVSEKTAPASPVTEAAPPLQPQEQKRASGLQPPFFTVHAGSYRTRASADAEAARIRAKGHEAFIERVDLGRRGVWFRVKVGRFRTRAEAETLRKNIHKVLVPDSMVVLQRAG